LLRYKENVTEWKNLGEKLIDERYKRSRKSKVFIPMRTLVNIQDEYQGTSIPRELSQHIKDKLFKINKKNGMSNTP